VGEVGASFTFAPPTVSRHLPSISLGAEKKNIELIFLIFLGGGRASKEQRGDACRADLPTSFGTIVLYLFLSLSFSFSLSLAVRVATTITLVRQKKTS
jgi:hypothetical protein